MNSGEQPRKAFDLKDEILKKLAQANGICNVMSRDVVATDESIRDSLVARRGRPIRPS